MRNMICLLLSLFVSFIHLNCIDIRRPTMREMRDADKKNLETLIRIYLEGRKKGKPVPKSRGHRFWLALFTGDPAGISGGLKIKDAYAPPSKAIILISSEDKGAKLKEVVRDIQELVDKGVSGWDQLGEDNLYTSYAGPKDIANFGTNEVVGCTGSKGGCGFWEDGFMIVRGNGKVEYLKYADLATKFPEDWDGDEDEPNWNSKLLKNRANLDSPPK